MGFKPITFESKEVESLKSVLRKHKNLEKLSIDLENNSSKVEEIASLSSQPI